MRIVEAVDRFLEFCARLLSVVATGVLLLMLALNLVNMTLRAFHQREIDQITPWTGFLFVWMCFLGFYVVHRQRRDIVVDYLVRKLALSGQKSARIFSDLIIITVLCLVLSQWPTIMGLQSGIINMVDIPRYYLSLPFFVTSALIVVDAAIDIVFALAGRRLDLSADIAEA